MSKNTVKFIKFHLLFKWLQSYAEKIAGLGKFEDKIPNHVLVNEYTAGQGIMVGTVWSGFDHYPWG